MKATDLDSFVTIYSKFGVECNINIEENHKVIYFNYYDKSVKSTNSSLFTGWNGFYSKIIFDIKGNFIEQGFWE